MKVSVETTYKYIKGDAYYGTRLLCPSGQIMSAILLSINKSPRWLANKTNTEYATIKNILEGGISVTPSIATAFEKATKFPAHSLLYQQEKFELFRNSVKK